MRVSPGFSAPPRSVISTVGVVPTRDDPGFGYIQPGAEIERGASRVARFVEKPDRMRAARMRADGYLWNSGIFVWRAGDILAEIDALCPEVAPALRAHGDDIAAFIGDVTPVAIDVGVMERSHRVLVLPGDFAWDDVGTWASLGFIAIAMLVATMASLTKMWVDRRAGRIPEDELGALPNEESADAVGGSSEYPTETPAQTSSGKQETRQEKAFGEADAGGERPH